MVEGDVVHGFNNPSVSRIVEVRTFVEDPASSGMQTIYDINNCFPCL